MLKSVYALLSQLQIPVLRIYSGMQQKQRIQHLARFRKLADALLLATDVAARGIDFPAVDWVVQFDCPEDAATYIHRVGRTARAGHAGRAVTFVEEDRRLAMKKLVRQAVEAKQQIKTRSVNKQVGTGSRIQSSPSRSLRRSWRI